MDLRAFLAIGAGAACHGAGRWRKWALDTYPQRLKSGRVVPPIGVSDDGPATSSTVSASWVWSGNSAT